MNPINKEALLQKERYTMEDLLSVMEILRSEQGCPWDREQTHKSIRSCLIEETYEVVEAIDREDAALLREELGDLLFQVIFHARIKEEEGAFGMGEVVHDITAKMIHRHPHVFGAVLADTSEQVLQNWEAIKTEEKQRNTSVERLRAIPPMLPALMRAEKVAKKTGDAVEGEWQSKLALAREALDKLSCMAERDESAGEKKQGIGALLYTVAALAHAMTVDAEEALSAETDRRIEREATLNGKK